MEDALFHISANNGPQYFMGGQIIISVVGIPICVGDVGAIAALYVKILHRKRAQRGEWNMNHFAYANCQYFSVFLLFCSTARWQSSSGGPERRARLLPTGLGSSINDYKLNHQGYLGEG